MTFIKLELIRGEGGRARPCGPEVHQHDQRDAESDPEPTVGEADAIDRGEAVLCGFVRRHRCWSGVVVGDEPESWMRRRGAHMPRCK